MANNLVKKKLEGKVAIVTGVFANHGARAVVIADIEAEKGRAVAESIGGSYVQCDEEQVAAMIEWTATTYGGLDIMFSNAGISSSAQAVLELDLSEWERVAARKMVELGTRGAIICTSRAVVGLMRSAAIQLGARCISPGA